ncbi:DUF2183 domain-containing protein [Oculatella sp. LEGE 06141]|uniref:App1 family protein n=1 Tax=Oculatella sp. LEGE 06141 TaxID=1828648 RepID=UPI00187E58C6|nr:phosphatase domain-containing protein [Oculatella sp. LEGE 06141]MBE9182752.1 DUF2183 domain-containing protein [Oculatella sp. LEGE 06141]
MTDWEKALSQWLAELESRYDTLKSTVQETVGWGSSLQLIPYRGYGSERQVVLTGRVLRDSNLSSASADSSVWENLLSTYKRFGTEVIPGIRVQVSIAGQQQEVVTDDRGYFRLVMAPVLLSGDRHYYDAELNVLPSSSDLAIATATTQVFVPSPQARFGVISDIDDTVVYTYSNDLLRMIQIVYLGNARTRIPFPGISAFYQALHQGDSGEEFNPFFYVSSSTWNIYDLLVDFLEIHGLPKGPLFLNNIDLSLTELLSFTHDRHKLSQIRPLFDAYPNLPFILVGDSGQRDAEIYHQLVHDYPNRILAIYIRNVSPHDFQRRQRLNAIAQEVQQLGVEFVTAPDTLIAATHAARRGWIAADTLPAIKADERYDQAQADQSM